MNYKDFIQSIIDSRGQFNIPENEYKERHHIIPRCMGGSNNKDNLIDLYAKEHFIAHKLLALENPDNHKLVSAWSMMAFPKGDTKREFYEEITADEYQLLRELQSKTQSEFAKQLWQDEDYRKAHEYSGERRKEYSERMKGNTLTLGKKHPPFTEEHKKRIGEGHKKSWEQKSEEEKEKIKQKLSEALSGEKNPMYSKHHSEETKKILSEKTKLLNPKERKWWNNGEKQVFQKECPNGFVPGRLPFKKGNKVGKYERKKTCE